MSLARAAVIVLLAACHPGNGSHAVDAAPDTRPADARPDAQMIDCSGAGVSNDIASLVLSDTTQLIDVTDGMYAPLRFPTQAGEYLLAGARVKTASTQLMATADLRDPTTNIVVALDMRWMYLASTGNGWSSPVQHPDYWSTMPNLSACPNPVLTQRVDGTPLLLEMAIFDGNTQIACLAATVIPDCQGNATCEAYCAAR